MAGIGRRRRAAPAPAGLFKRLFDIFLAVAILGLLILLAARLDRTETRRPQGIAVVNDGDSITLGAERIRLLGIDAPEYDQSCLRNGATYACGRAARDALKALIAGQTVSCAGWERDRYGRLLATCTANGRELNRKMVVDGWALAYGDFEAEQSAAQKSGEGLWAGSFDRPRDWRSQHGGMAEAEHGCLRVDMELAAADVRFFDVSPQTAASEYPPEDLGGVVAEARACRICVETPRGAPLPHAPRPVLMPSSTARVLIAGQAPGTKVHLSGVPFTDRSGDRLRDWLGVTSAQFYDARNFAILPMGFCFPGQDGHGGDLPPRRECAPAWRDRLMAAMPQVDLILAIGLYAQAWHMGSRRLADRNRCRLAVDLRRLHPASRAAAAAPFVAQHRLAEAQSLVRNGFAAFSSAGNPKASFSRVEQKNPFHVPFPRIPFLFAPARSAKMKNLF